MIALKHLNLQRCSSLVFGCGLFVASVAYGQTAPTYTLQQAQQGEAIYQQRCVLCHSADLSGNNFGPPLKGPVFLQHWSGRNVFELFELTSTTMPPDQAGALGDTAYLQLVAYLLQQNAIAGGLRKLPRAQAQLSAQILPNTETPARGRVRTDYGGPLTAGIELPPWPANPNPLEHYRQVTDKMLAAPNAGEWLTWRRTQDLQGYSPLKQINKKMLMSCAWLGRWRCRRALTKWNRWYTTACCLSTAMAIMYWHWTR